MKQASQWTASTAYQPGDRIRMHMARSQLAIWRDRIRYLRWIVPLTELRTFQCVDMSPGALWPMVD